METICVKMEERLLEEMDQKIKHNRYSTRTEFIRDAIRSKLSEIEKSEVLKKLANFKGSLNGKSRMSDEDASRRASLAIAEKFGIRLD